MKTSSYFYKVTSPSTSMQALKSTSLPSLPSSTSMFGSTPTTCRLWITMANVNLTGNILSVLLTAHTKRFSDSLLRDFHLFELLVKGCIANFGLTMVSEQRRRRAQKKTVMSSTVLLVLLSAHAERVSVSRM